MKRFFMAALAVALLASAAQAANVASITEDFGSTTWSTPAALIYQNKTTVVSKEVPTAKHSPNGFKWGGWYPGPATGDTTNNNRIAHGGQGTPNYTTTIPILVMGGNTAQVLQAGGYAYTIFSTAVGVTAPDTVTNAASVTLITPAANAATEQMTGSVGVLLRNSAGDWFQQIDGLQDVAMTENVENTYVITLAGKNFQQLTGPAPIDMNEMDAGVDVNDYSPGALTVSGTNVSAPTDVTGVGVFNAANGVGSAGLKLRTVTVTGSLPPAPGVAVTVNSNPVADGETVPVALGSYEVAETAADVTFTVSNPGTLPLTVTGITVPTGVIIVEDLTAGDIAPAGSDTFIVKVDTTAEVTIAGEISFTTNVTGAETFNFAVSGNTGPISAVREWEQY